MGEKAVLYFCVSVKCLLGFGWLFWVQRGPRCDKHCNDIVTYKHCNDIVTINTVMT